MCVCNNVQVKWTALLWGCWIQSITLLIFFSLWISTSKRCSISNSTFFCVKSLNLDGFTWNISSNCSSTNSFFFFFFCKHLVVVNWQWFYLILYSFFSLWIIIHMTIKKQCLIVELQFDFQLLVVLFTRNVSRKSLSMNWAENVRMFVLYFKIIVSSCKCICCLGKCICEWFVYLAFSLELGLHFRFFHWCGLLFMIDQVWFLVW